MVVIATDGSYRKTTTKASWAVATSDKIYGELVENFIISGIDESLTVMYDRTKPCPGTNNRGELAAILVALQLSDNNVVPGEEIIIISDSEYSIKTITLWYPKWISENRLSGKLNLDVVEVIMQKKEQMENKGHKIVFHKVKSHTKPIVYMSLPEPERTYYIINNIADVHAQKLTS